MSPHEILRVATRAIGEFKPNSIVEIGCGYGLYGMICRFFFDTCWGRFNKQTYQIKIDAIEAWEGQLSTLQYEIYDNIFIGDAKELVNTIGTYDIAILIEVIEHFEKADGVNFLRKLMEKVRKGIVLSTPRPECWQPQQNLFGNELERHRSIWQPDEFRQFGLTEVFMDNPSYVVKIHKQQEIVVGIVAYKNLNLLQKTVESIRQTTPYKLIVFDNSPVDDETRMWLQQQQETLHLLPWDKYNWQKPDEATFTNPGTWFGKNKIIQYVQSYFPDIEYLLLIDSDIELLDDCVNQMLIAIQKDDMIGYVGCPMANMGFAVNNGYTEELASNCNMTRVAMWKEVGLYPESLMYYSGDSWHHTLANMYGWKTYQLDKDYYIHHAHGSQSNPGVKEQASKDVKKWAETEAKWEAYWRKRFEKGKQ